MLKGAWHHLYRQRPPSHKRLQRKPAKISWWSCLKKTKKKSEQSREEEGRVLCKQHEISHVIVQTLHHLGYKGVEHLNSDLQRNQYWRMTRLTMKLNVHIQLQLRNPLHCQETRKMKRIEMLKMRIKRLKLLRTSRSFVKAKEVSRLWDRKKGNVPSDPQKVPYFLQLILIVNYNLAIERNLGKRLLIFPRLRRERNLTMITQS